MIESTLKYLDVFLNIKNPYHELKLNKTHHFYSKAPILYSDLPITNCIFSTEMYDKQTILILK